jgi:hypothetical protein
MGRMAATAIKDRGASMMSINKSQIIYWHRELPPLEAEAVAEHVVEATSRRVPGTFVHRSELWDQCYKNLMAQTHTRLQQEVLRLGGDYAHVLDEFIDSRHDDVTGETWLHGRFDYMLYRRPTYKGQVSKFGPRTTK